MIHRAGAVLTLLLAAAVLSGCFRSGAGKPPTAARPASVTFTDVTREAGIDFVHFNGAYGKKLFPEMMGSGAAWLDGDGDGLLDLLLLNCASLPGDPSPRKPGNRYYRNEGGGRFSDRTAESGLAGGGYAMGVAVGDADNDGDIDVFISHLGRDRYYRNRGKGVFDDATTAAGLGHTGFGSSAAFLDYDQDGRLDLFVCNYTELPNPIDKIVCRNPRGGLQYCDVHLYDGLTSLLYHNNGDGSFSDVSKSSGIASKRGRSLAVVCGDVDDDGDDDIIVANDENPNFLWRNNGNGTFTESAGEAGLAYDARGETIAGMGLDLGDVDGDGQPDLYESGFQGEPNVLFRRLAPGVFIDHTSRIGIGEMTRERLSFGLGFLDYDRDGWPDLFVANGHVIDDVTEFNPAIPYEQPASLFRNDGTGRFVDAAEALGEYGRRKWVGRGVALADYDNDGDVDILATNNHQPAVLLNNGASSGHWLGVRCLTKSGRDAYGARVRLTTPSRVQLREVRSAHSYLCGSDPRLLFGLGAESGAVSLQIRWPGGGIETVSNVAVDGYVTVVQGAGLRTAAGARPASGETRTED